MIADGSRRLAQIIFLADVRGFLSQMFADFSRRLARMFLADFRGFFLADWRGCFWQIFADFFSQIGADYFSITICEHQRFKHLRKSAITICEK
jgi:arginine/ornithine N-succinyltransferase beta subunit